MTGYGKELILDLCGCRPETMTRRCIYAFTQGACKRMEVEACDFHFWDDDHLPAAEQETDPKRKGISAVQFLLASSIVIHTLDMRREVYINAFSCDYFDERLVKSLAIECFGGRVASATVVLRGPAR